MLGIMLSILRIKMRKIQFLFKGVQLERQAVDNYSMGSKCFDRVKCEVIWEYRRQIWGLVQVFQRR